jgi:hypothetical protein
MPIKQGSILKSTTAFFSNTSVTAKTLLLTLTPFITVIIESKMAIIGLGFIMFLDLLTGMNKSLYVRGIKKNPFKADFWKCITSKGMRDTWRKGYEYGAGIIIVLAIEVFFFPGTTVDVLNQAFSITELAIIIASAIEIWSIFENIEEITESNPLKKAGQLILSIKKLWKS